MKPLNKDIIIIVLICLLLISLFSTFFFIRKSNNFQEAYYDQSELMLEQSIMIDQYQYLVGLYSGEKEFYEGWKEDIEDKLRKEYQDMIS